MNPNNMMMNMLMNKLQSQNPQAYAQINQWMSSGQNPQQIINQMLQSRPDIATTITKRTKYGKSNPKSKYKKILNTNSKNKILNKKETNLWKIIA